MYQKYLSFKDVDTFYIQHVIDDFRVKFPNSRVPNGRTIRRIAQKFEKEGTVNNLPHVNRKRHVLTPQKLAEVKGGLEHDSLLEMGDPSVSSARRNVFGLTPSSFHRATKILGFHCYRPRAIHAMKESDEGVRKSFAEGVNGLQMSPERMANMAFSDEAGFSLDGTVNSQNERRYSKRGEGGPDNLLHTKEKFPKKLMVFLGVHSSGKVFGLTIYKQGQSLTSKTYRKLLEETVIPELKELNPESPGTLDGMTWVQDGASIHKTDENIKFLSDAGFQSRIFSATNKRCPTLVELPWPPRSPELNPLDFWVWSELKRQVYFPKPQNLEELEQSIVNAVFNLDPESIKKACASFFSRCQKLTEADGGYIE